VANGYRNGSKKLLLSKVETKQRGVAPFWMIIHEGGRGMPTKTEPLGLNFGLDVVNRHGCESGRLLSRGTEAEQAGVGPSLSDCA
jgi:hypothetical protein